LAPIATTAAKARVDEQKRRVEIDTVLLRPSDHRKVLEPAAAVAFDPKAFSIVGNAAQRAPFSGIILWKLVPAGITGGVRDIGKWKGNKGSVYKYTLLSSP
jgi:hypothetical protein